MNDRYEEGINELKKHLGEDAESYIRRIEEISPFFAKINVEFAYGDIYKETDKVLDSVTQELITVSALTVLGYATPQLKVHVDAALNRGATKEQVIATITQMIDYCGFPAATNALLAAKEVFDAREL
ncbi:MAG: carboxymuconolactone decarboxylase family protein [Helicobacteraceae bacterium]|nr:carboxymuconolactone decarboxylase family protein [Helicobacteraceae bacterium]